MHSRPLTPRRRSSGFSLVELIIVVVIIGLLAAIAIPRFSQGAGNTNKTAFAGDMAVLRNAIELYAVEHGGAYPLATTFEEQLTLFSNEDGQTDANGGEDYPLGPYLVAVPALKVGNKKGNNGVVQQNTVPTGESPAENAGWLFDTNTGRIWPNDSENFQ